MVWDGADTTQRLKAARDFLVENRTDYLAARAGFEWPRFKAFNFATDWFDTVVARGDREALRIVSLEGEVVSRTYGELSAASQRVANFLKRLGVKRGDVVMVMLGAEVALWEVLLACIRLGAVILPATTQLSSEDITDRLERGQVRLVVATADCVDRFASSGEGWTGVAVGGRCPSGWQPYDAADAEIPVFTADAETPANSPLLLYFTSGTTAKPKLVRHTNVSYPVGHLSTLYWIGLKPGDVHLNISSPGWAKHAWSSVFAPWLAEATVMVLNHPRFNARATLDAIAAQRVTTFCAPPTVWRMLIQEALPSRPPELRELVSAGEPLNAEVISQVQAAWGLTIRDGFGQSETTALIGNPPGLEIRTGSVGVPLPGYDIVLEGVEGIDGEGEILVRRGDAPPVGLMSGYSDVAAGDNREAFHRTGDIAMRDIDGYFTFVGRADDVFKASDYRISPFELESVLIEHPAVAEAAVVPSPDPVRHAVAKAFIGLAPGQKAEATLAQSIFEHAYARLGAYKRVRRIEFFELPKTISGKIRRVELRNLEADRRQRDIKGDLEWFDTDFPRDPGTPRAGLKAPKPRP